MDGVRNIISDLWAKDNANYLPNAEENSQYGYNVKNKTYQHLNGSPKISEEKSSNDTILEMGDEYLSNASGTTVQLFDFLVRKITGAKPLSFRNNDISESTAQGYVLNITTVFSQTVKQSANKSGISVKSLRFDLVKIQREIKGKIISGKLKDIPEVLKSHVVQALPKKLDSKQLNKFEVEFDKEINAKLDKLMENNMLSNGNISVTHEQHSTNANKYTPSSISKHITSGSRNNRNTDKPTAGLSGVSITGNSTQIIGGY